VTTEERPYVTNNPGGRLNRKETKNILYILLGIAMNVIAAYIAWRSGLPIFLDTVGTVFVAASMGPFPGIVAAVATNTICTLFNPSAIYFSIVNVLVALFAGWFGSRHSFKKYGQTAVFFVCCGLLSGVLGSLIQWGILDGPQNRMIADVIESVTVVPRFISFLIFNTILNIFDKGISVGFALLAFDFIPEKKLKDLKSFGWQQKPLSDEELKAIKKHGSGGGLSVRTRMSLTIIGISLVLVVIMGIISTHLYFESLRDEKREAAISSAHFAAQVVNPDSVAAYLINGRDIRSYEETEKMLYNILDNASGVNYLYVIKFDNDECYTVFDIYRGEEELLNPGERFPVEDVFKPYMESFKTGNEIGPIEWDDFSRWTLTSLYPVRDLNGRTVCYAGADASLEYMNVNMRVFILKVSLTLAGFFVLAIAFGLWITSIYTVYPLGTITACIDEFADSDDSQEKLDDNVRLIRSLDIHTGDEVEGLYKAICNMTLEQAEKMRQIRHYSETTANMQEGLIITMADMVENRDSDTGAHVQKTAAYVKIIAEGLKKKGYYAQKITDKYISDIVRSAPLHDVGKINIPDGVLNKPGKLTDEEYEIMKTHTTAGKRMMEKAISTVHGESYLKEARNMAAYHHERWDGKGYPEGLHGEVIPLSARIMAVADVFDALTSPRVYKPAFPLEKALSIIQEGSGSQFDAKCVEVFMDSLTEVKVILKKYNGQDD
jgi:HD-GYP domain-containing protein (c-di-GMP phosphodiesterase class II)/lipoprotein signal peptidase